MSSTSSSHQKHAGGRPSKLAKSDRPELIQALHNYINEQADPTIVKFCTTHPVALKYNILPPDLSKWPEFRKLVKKAIAKQEAYITEYATQGKINPTFAIFRLKQPQHGWTDKQEIDHTSLGKGLTNPMASLTVEQLRKLAEVSDAPA